jgi:hypothetical protein
MTFSVLVCFVGLTSLSSFGFNQFQELEQPTLVTFAAFLIATVITGAGHLIAEEWKEDFTPPAKIFLQPKSDILVITGGRLAKFRVALEEMKLPEFAWINFGNGVVWTLEIEASEAMGMPKYTVYNERDNAAYYLDHSAGLLELRTSRNEVFCAASQKDKRKAVISGNGFVELVATSEGGELRGEGGELLARASRKGGECEIELESRDFEKKELFALLMFYCVFFKEAWMSSEKAEWEGLKGNLFYQQQ